jgi:hypothetical protein
MKFYKGVTENVDKFGAQVSHTKIRRKKCEECRLENLKSYKEKVFISTYVRKHLICELQLKNTSSSSALQRGKGLLKLPM